VLACDRQTALKTFESVVATLEAGIASRRELSGAIAEQARVLAQIPLKGRIEDVPKVSLLGEIFVRTDGFSRQNLVERLANKGILVQVAPVSEYMYFCDYLMQKSLYHVKPSVVEKMMSVVRSYVKGHYEKSIKEALAESGLYVPRLIHIDSVVDKVKHLIPPQFTAGETVLTVASAVNEMLEHVNGVISIGPFGCMPGRVGEAILSESLNAEIRKRSAKNPWIADLMERHPSLPFLCLESDGNPFPQIIEAKLELFSLQVLRLHETSTAADSRSCRI
jgi:predicted nucleotide-binding protein (sugar kinase/HSP70/actin superfamily)